MQNNLSTLELSILMPCLNEAETLEICIRKAQDFLKKNQIQGEVVIGDNGSTDGSQEIAKRNGARVIDVPIRGYGAALYYGTLGCKGKYIIMGDSDDSYDFSRLMPFVEKLREGFDLVMGNRFRGGIAPGAMPWKNKWIGNPVLTTIGRVLFRSDIGDFHCGLRGFSVEGFKKMDLHAMGMEFASEMVLKSHLLGLRITEVPTTLSPDGRSRPPHLRPWRDGWRHLRLMLLFSPRWLFLIPGFALFTVGLLLGARVWWSPWWVGSVSLDVNTLVYASAAVLLGFQAMLFAIFSKVFAIQEKLLPEDPRLNQLFKYFTLETGLIASLFLILAGLLGAILNVYHWQMAGFGPLDPRQSLRAVIPSGLALTLGFQTAFASFFLSVLKMQIQKRSSP